MQSHSEEQQAWLRLVRSPGIGPGTARRLLLALGSPQAIFDAPEATLAQLVTPRERQALMRPPEGLDDDVARTTAWLQAAPHRALLTLGDADYPPALLQASDPPLVLFAEGDLSLAQAPSVAIVGSRHATAQGIDNARMFAQALSAAGVTVVSGLARGIDAAAHEGALAGQVLLPEPGRPGGTVAVVGTGLDLVYPKAHTRLAQQIAHRGLLLSEFLLGTPPLAGNFPRRNRIVAALSWGTLVIEAAVQSGSLITARLAAELGREVMAIPGSIHAPQSRGCHALIKQGAKLVETAADVMEELQLATLPAVSSPRAAVPDTAQCDPDDHGDPLVAAMGFDPVSQEALAARTGLPPAELGARLLELELMGVVARLPGALFQRRAAA